jgi:uncharacterized OsmC-like protein
MVDPSERHVSMSRLSKGHYEVVNERGGRIEIASGVEPGPLFTPVELLLAAIGGCTAMDVDFITSKRSEPDRFDVRVRGDKVRDDRGNHLTGLRLTFDLAFPDDEGGAAAAAVLQSAVQASHDRLCTVSRTVEIGTPVEVEIVSPEATAPGA